jgi:hypothetical protein
MRPDAASQEHVDDVICPRCTTSPINHSAHDQPRPRTLASGRARAPHARAVELISTSRRIVSTDVEHRAVASSAASQRRPASLT